MALLGQRWLYANERALGCGRKRRWRDKLIELTALSTGFDKLQYGTMEVSKPRLVLDKPVRWVRDPVTPTFSGALSLNAGETPFCGRQRVAPVGC